LESAPWRRAAEQWERFGVSGWTFGDLPERVTISEGPGLPVYGWPAPAYEEGRINVRLFHNSDAAREAGAEGARRLLELALQKDLAWLEKDLRGLSRFEPLYAPVGDGEELRATALENLKKHILPQRSWTAYTVANFQAAVEQAKRLIPGLAFKLIDQVGGILQIRQQVSQRLGSSPTAATVRGPTKLRSLQQLDNGPAPGGGHPLNGELRALLPPRFLERVPFERLTHLPRYLKALLIRIERAALNPAKDQERVQQLQPFVEAVRRLGTSPHPSEAFLRELDELQWMIEEFKVSLFAQELGTAFPVSVKRLQEKLERLR
jgi:ATP-dependent helicase HrpA